ncbi:glycosyltransferase family 2 protein [Yoonia sp.]|uniref:glycosyltransferase family 2 protein n=1 Tax=Yoonia sp. TaxID=2212373 RepID=UPI002FD88476
MHHLKHTSPHGTVMAVSMMKDEAPFLLEWFAHHLAVGFSDILVYTNDCTDGTVEMLERLEELGLGYHRPNDIPEGVKPQPSAIKHAQAEPLVRNADWVILFDADEFLAISHPSGTVDGMITDAVAEGANGIVITWRIFGSGGITDWSRAPVTEQYLRAAPPLWNKGWGVKTLFKFDPDYWKLGIHRPAIKNRWLQTDFPETVKWLNGSGQPMEDYFKFRGWRSIRRTLGYDWAQMNHYAVKSVDAYALRKFRGNVNNKKDKYNADYWSLQDRNEVEDRVILRHAKRRRAIMDELLKDPVLNHLHHKALDRIEARLAEYKQTESYRALRDSLIAAGEVPITQVVAKPPVARDPAKIAALMSRVEQSVADQPKEDRRHETIEGWGHAGGYHYVTETIDLSGDIPVDWVPNHDIALPADPRIFNPEALNAVLSGRFDRKNARNIGGYLEGMNRLLEIGTGVGFLAIKAVRDTEGLVVMAQDGRKALIRMAKDIALRNGIGDTARLKFSDADLVFPADKDGAASGLAAYLRDFRPDALRLGSAPDLPPNVLAKADLRHVRRVIIPFHDNSARDTYRAAYGPLLAKAGLHEVEGRDAAGSLQFDRLE